MKMTAMQAAEEVAMALRVGHRKSGQPITRLNVLEILSEWQGGHAGEHRQAVARVANHRTVWRVLVARLAETDETHLIARKA